MPMCVFQHTFSGTTLACALSSPLSFYLSVCPSITNLLSLVISQLSSIYIHQCYLLSISIGVFVVCLFVHPFVCLYKPVHGKDLWRLVYAPGLYSLFCVCSTYIYRYVHVAGRAPCMQEDVPMCCLVESVRMLSSLTPHSVYSDLGLVAGPWAPWTALSLCFCAGVTHLAFMRVCREPALWSSYLHGKHFTLQLPLQPVLVHLKFQCSVNIPYWPRNQLAQTFSHFT